MAPDDVKEKAWRWRLWDWLCTPRGKATPKYTRLCQCRTLRSADAPPLNRFD